MPHTNRPVSGASIESAWGAEIHDWTFAPVGTRLESSVTTSCGSSMTQLRLDSAVDDPGGWLDASPLPGNAEAPTGAGGLYLIVVRINTTNGTSGEFTRARIEVNGSSTTVGVAVQAGGSLVQFTMVDFLEVSAGDTFTVSAQKIGAGSNPDVAVGAFAMIRVADSIGA